MTECHSSTFENKPTQVIALRSAFVMPEENQSSPDTSGSSSENINIPPISKPTAGAAAGLVLGSVAGPVGALVGGVLGALAGQAAASASSTTPSGKRTVKAVARSEERRG